MKNITNTTDELNINIQDHTPMWRGEKQIYFQDFCEHYYHFIFFHKVSKLISNVFLWPYVENGIWIVTQRIISKKSSIGGFFLHDGWKIIGRNICMQKIWGEQGKSCIQSVL